MKIKPFFSPVLWTLYTSKLGVWTFTKSSKPFWIQKLIYFKNNTFLRQKVNKVINLFERCCIATPISSNTFESQSFCFFFFCFSEAKGKQGYQSLRKVHFDNHFALVTNGNIIKAFVKAKILLEISFEHTFKALFGMCLY